MWELVTQILRLPFDIMQRVSQRVLHIGRAIYTGIFGSPPAIKPSTPPKISTSRQSPPPIQTANFSQISVPCKILTPPPSPPPPLTTSCVVIDMEPSSPPIVEESSTKNTMSLTAANPETSSIMSDAQKEDNVGLILSSTDKLSDVTSNAVIIEQAAEVAAVLTKSGTETRGVKEDDEQVVSCKVADDKDADAASAPLNRREKRFREKEDVNKRNLIGSYDNKPSLENTSSVHEHGSAKKPKLSVESSVSSCQDALEKISKNKKRRSKKKQKLQEARKGEGNTEVGSKMEHGGGGGGGRPPPPNFFIALQISNQDIISKVAQLQKSLTERELNPPWHELTTTEIFKDAMVPVSKLHFTLHVMHLKGEDDLQKAQSALTECCREVHQEFTDNPMDLTIEGLGHFRNNVIFAQIKEKSHIARFTKVSEIFRKKFNALDIPVDPRPFNPHMTIAKISRSNKLYKKKIRAFPPDIWSGCEQTHFGIQRVSGLQLLQMAGEDKTTGYYVCHGQYYFEDPLAIKEPSPSKVDQDTEEDHQQKNDNDEDQDKK